jgi:putative transposase
MLVCGVRGVRGFRFPAEIIQHAVRLYYCFSLGLSYVETILATRRVVVSYESIPGWGLSFGRMFADPLKRRRPRSGDKSFMDVNRRMRSAWPQPRRRKCAVWPRRANACGSGPRRPLSPQMSDGSG